MEGTATGKKLIIKKKEKEGRMERYDAHNIGRCMFCVGAEDID